MCNTLKALFYTALIVGAVALTVTTVYFLTIFGGAAILLLLVFFVVREIIREPNEENHGD